MYIKKYLKIFIDKENSLYKLLLIGFLLRILWILIIHTQPTSDFKLMYDTANIVANGNNEAFFGNSYFARFPHDSVTVLYFSMFFRLFKGPLFIIKLVNVLLGTFNVWIVYKIGKNMFNKKLGRIAAFIITFFPPFIIYCSETMAENMAIPLFLTSIYFFFKFTDKQKVRYAIISAILLSFGDLFRPVGKVFIIAYLIYYILIKIKINSRKNIIKSIIAMGIGFIIPTIFISNILVKNNILENQIWKPKEPIIMTILKGTNFETTGAWSEIDSSIPQKYNYNKQEIERVAKGEIINRIREHNFIDIIKFYTEKFVMQWGFGDFGGCSWALEGNPGVKIGYPYISLLSTTLLIFSSIYYFSLIGISILGIVRKKFSNKIMFMYLLLLGFTLFYLLTERQARYAYVCSWIFIFTATNIFSEDIKKNVQ